MAEVRVFGTAELLEHILLQVHDTKTLLLAQRVNKQWQSLLNTSPELRKALFFDFDHTRKHEHVWAPPDWPIQAPCLTCHESDQHLNPLLVTYGDTPWEACSSVQVIFDVQALPPYSSAMKMYASRFAVTENPVWCRARPKMFGGTVRTCKCPPYSFIWKHDETVGEFVAHINSRCSGHMRFCPLWMAWCDRKCFDSEASDLFRPRYRPESPEFKPQPCGSLNFARAFADIDAT